MRLLHSFGEGIEVGTTAVEQRVRVAIIRIEAAENQRPVQLPRLMRELSDLAQDDVRGALGRLYLAGVVRNVEGGWLSRPPPRAILPVEALATNATLHR